MYLKTKKGLNNMGGFTLIELMVVLIIMGVILSIGMPKYARIQAQAEYDADVATIKRLAKEVEMYAVKEDNYTDKTISTLTSQNVIENVVLNRKKSGNKSVKNDGSKISSVGGTLKFKFNSLGFITDESLNAVINGLIGPPVY